jgi:glycosyltransferase involved in cell wall biosynthesis
LNKYQDSSKAPGFLVSHDGILCFAGEDWWYHNQAHFDMQIMRRMARHLPILYVNSVGFRMPSVMEGTQFIYRIGRKLGSMMRPTNSPFAGFHVASLISVPMWHRPFLAKLNVLSLEAQVRKACREVGLKNPLIWVACPAAFQVARRMQRNSFLLYQRTDRYEEYSEQTREYLTTADRWLSQNADLILYVSRVLYEEERGQKSRSILVKHGVELDHFNAAKALQLGKPPDVANIKRPIVGFFGDIEDNLVDMALVGEAVRALSDVSFVFVGRVAADVGQIRNLPNIHFLGKKPYGEIPQYGAQFDVALMPLKANRYKFYSSPIKLKEYLALGLPIVSTEFPEASYYKDVLYVARHADDFINGIREALQGRGVGTAESRRSRVSGDTWEQAALGIAETIRKLAGRSLGTNDRFLSSFQ